jgi:hypothetical protein
MWQPRFEQFTKLDGTVQKIGWIVVDEAGKAYEEGGAVPTSYYREDAQELADRLNQAK